METQTCLRCGAPVEEDDTVCFACGAPIGDSKTPTQPVPLPRRAQRAATSQPVSSATSSAATAAPARAASSRPLPPAPAAARPAIPPSNRWALLLLGAVVLALLAAGAGLALRATLVAPPITQTSLYTDPAHRFSFQRPSLWSLTTAPDSVLLTDSDGASTVRVTLSPATGDESAPSAADALATATPGLTTAPAHQIAGQSWEQRAGQVTGSDGATREVADYLTIHGGKVYTIECSSPIASFAATNNLVFQPLLASFAFS